MTYTDVGLRDVGMIRYRLREGPDSANQNDRKLGVFLPDIQKIPSN